MWFDALEIPGDLDGLTLQFPDALLGGSGCALHVCRQHVGHTGRRLHDAGAGVSRRLGLSRRMGPWLRLSRLRLSRLLCAARLLRLRPALLLELSLGPHDLPLLIE